MSSLIVNLINELDCAIDRDDTSSIWENPGSRELDDVLTPIADYYIQHPHVRDEIRDEVLRVSSTWPLVLFVRRISQLLESEQGADWLNRGLATASMIDANCDYRDLIVSLVLLRDAGDRAGLGTSQAFDAALTWSTEKMHGILRNARDHSESTIRSTVSAFGLPTQSKHNPG